MSLEVKVNHFIRKYDINKAAWGRYFSKLAYHVDRLIDSGRAAELLPLLQDVGAVLIEYTYDKYDLTEVCKFTGIRKSWIADKLKITPQGFEKQLRNLSLERQAELEGLLSKVGKEALEITASS